MAVVDHHAVTDLRLRSHQQIDLLAGTDGERLVVDETFEFVRRHAASRHIVDIDVDHIGTSGEDSALLVAVGQKEVFARKPPVEERSVEILVDHFQECGLAGAGQRRFARGHEPVFGVVIDEDVDRVAHLVGERNVAVGQQYLLPLLIGEIETVVRDTGHGERMVLSGFHS